jgi:hypothetical protein
MNGKLPLCSIASKVTYELLTQIFSPMIRPEMFDLGVKLYVNPCFIALVSIECLIFLSSTGRGW